MLKDLPTRIYPHSDEYYRQKETEEAKKALGTAKSHLADFDAHPPAKPYPIRITREFEVHGWDVALQAALRMEQLGIYEETPRALIEIKPALGDDFPAVLRQMKANTTTRDSRGNTNRIEGWHGWSFLLVDQFTATGATLEQVSKMFSASQFALVTLATVEEQIAEFDRLNPMLETR